MDYKDSVSLQKAFSAATNLLSNLRTRLAHNTLGLLITMQISKRFGGFSWSCSPAGRSKAAEALNIIIVTVQERAPA